MPDFPKEKRVNNELRLERFDGGGSSIDDKNKLEVVEVIKMCLICERIEMIKNNENQYFVKELETGYVVLGDNQHFKGYTIFLCKQHKTELFELEKNFKLKFLEEMSLVGEAVYKGFNADKINYELLGNGDSHLHWHLFPRVVGDIENYGNKGKGPVWWYPMELMYSDSNRPSDTELMALKEKLLAELNKIFNK